MVDRSASRWGVRHGGRCVWFELERNVRPPTHGSDGIVGTTAPASQDSSLSPSVT